MVYAMELIFRRDYKSIKKFDPVEMGEFSILVGSNGAGKTHLLKAIDEGYVRIDDISTDRILYFDYTDFLIGSQRAIGTRDILDEKKQAWRLFNTLQRGAAKIDESIKQIVGNVHRPYDRAVDDGASSEYQAHIATLEDLLNRVYRKRGPKLLGLAKSAIYESGKYASEMVESDFNRYSRYQPTEYGLVDNLSELFLDYNIQLNLARLSDAEGGEGLNDDDLSKMEDQAPWRFINELLAKYGMGEHSLSFPAFTPGDFMKSGSNSFNVRFKYGDDEISFEDLSSGEKVLCALALSVYQDGLVSFPRLILLDEVDSSLHPSMIRSLLEVLQGIFVPNDCSVIMTTHSATTAALADDSSLFEVKAGAVSDKVLPISKASAVGLLSEGIITYEKGLRIEQSIDPSRAVQLLTEGNNVGHIEAALSVLAPALLDDVNLIDGGGGDDLKNAYSVFQRANHSGRFLFVWDCDFSAKTESLEENESFNKFCFEPNFENKIAVNKSGNPAGIENVYPELLFGGDVQDTKSTWQPNVGSMEYREFNKKKFLIKIQGVTDPEMFSGFAPLARKIESIVNEHKTGLS